MSRKVYAEVSGTILIPVKVIRKVIVTVDEGASVDDAIRSAAHGESGGDSWDAVDNGLMNFQGDLDDIEELVDNAVDDDINFTIQEVNITDSK